MNHIRHDLYKIAFAIMALLNMPICASAQKVIISLEESIHLARKQSVQALRAKSSFVSNYWAWRAYRASRLPSLNLYGTVGSFNRSLVLLQNYQTGEMVYTGTYNMQNNLGLSLRQVLPATGGMLSLYSDLSRVDQFGTGQSHIWYAQPLSLSYTQPLFSFNQYKWDEKISPKEYELARRKYIESMEEVTVKAASLFFNLHLACSNYEIAKTNYRNSRKSLEVCKEKVKLGMAKRDENLQLELKVLNDSIAVKECMVGVQDARMSLGSFIGLGEKEEIETVLSENLPDLEMNYDFVLGKTFENSSFALGNEISLLNAEQAIAQAKANRGLSMRINAKFGLSNSAGDIEGTYSDLLDQEVFGVTFSIPIFDWGLGRGRVRKAEAAAEVVKAQVQQSETDFKRSIISAVGQFNNQKSQCEISKRAMEISSERYALMLDKFSAGGASVLDLKTAQEESEAAVRKHVRDMANFWNYYYTIRQLTLYDFIEGRDVEVQFSELID